MSKEMKVLFYRLFYEYLKRSDDYKKYCLSRRIHNSSLKQIKSKIVKVKRGEFSFGFIYYKYGDVHLVTFDEWWDWYKKNMTKIEPCIYEYRELVDFDLDMSFFETRNYFQDKNVSIEDFHKRFKHYFKKKLKHDDTLHLVIDCLFNTKELNKSFNEHILDRKQQSQIKNNLKRRRMLKMVTDGRLQEVERYLAIYDRKTQGMSIRKIIEDIGNNNDKSKSKDVNVQRKYWRYLNKAITIIKNTEEGIFPGKY